MIFSSIRVRLAAWYASVLAAFLLGLAIVVYTYVARETSARIDRSLRQVAQAFVTLWRTANARADSTLASRLVSDVRADEFEIVVFDEAQRVLVSNTRSSRLRRPRPTAAPPAAPDSSSRVLARPDLASLFREAGASGEAFATLEGPLGKERGYAIAVNLPGRREVVAVMQQLERQTAFLGDLRAGLIGLIPVGLLLAFGGGVFLAGRALRPVGEMAQRAAGIGASTLDARLPVANPSDELGRLAEVFNRLLGRLEAAFDQQRVFMAEASHELRTPIAVIRGEADLSLSKDERGEAEYRESLDVIREESRRMTRIIDDLFLLALADTGQLSVTKSPVDLDQLLHASARSAQALAAAKGARVTVAVPEPVGCHGDPSLLGRLLMNLVDNAIKYGKPGGTVRLTAGTAGDTVRVEVADDGRGIPKEAQPRIFDRFYRGPEAGSTAQEGNGSGAGLGLAIGRSIAEAHGGHLTLRRSDPTGTVFLLELPAARAA